MFVRKREVTFVVILLSLVVVLGLVFWSSDGITGFAVLGTGVGIAPGLDQNDSRPFDLEIEPVEGLSLVNSSAPVTVAVQASSSGTSSSDVGIQANCASWPCSCGDSVTASMTMT